MTDLTIVMPAFNEQASLATTVTALRSCPRFAEAEILVVDDGSTDATGQVAGEHGAQVLRNSRNQGYGASLKRGIRASKTDLVAWFDADGQHDPADLAVMLDRISADSADAVIAERTLSGSSDPYRVPGKIALRWLIEIVTGRRIVDPNCGLRVFRRSVALRYLHLLPDGFSASTTLTLILMHRQYSVVFHPIRPIIRKQGRSSVRQLKDGLASLYTVLRITILFSAFRVFGSAALWFFSFGMVYGLYTAFTEGRGFPTFGLLAVMLGVQLFFLGILCDQISALRMERLENPLDYYSVSELTSGEKHE